jgi:hypothetical protein
MSDETNKGNRMIEEYLQMLGMTMRDKVTGVKGMVDSICFDAYGCVQATIRRPVKEDGTFPETHWFDVKRLEVAGERIMPEQHVVKKGTEIGAADKPARPV